MDNRRAVCMAMLDLSAAFDTLDHDSLIERLTNTQGLGPRVIYWFNSYLRRRTQLVSVDNATSDHMQLLDGAVQGSKMGCRIYKKYVEPLVNMLKNRNVITMATLIITLYGRRWTFSLQWIFILVSQR